MAGKEAIITRIRDHFKELHEADAAAKVYHQRYLAEVDAIYKTEGKVARAEHDRLTAKAEETFNSEIAAARSSVSEAVEQLGLLAAPWNSLLWPDYDPVLRGQANGTEDKAGFQSVPGGVRVGTLRIPDVDIGAVPALVPLTGNGHLFVVSNGATKGRALDMLQSAITRTAVTFPPLSARFIFIDPLGLGSNFPFKRLPDTIRGDTVYSEPDEIRMQMREMTEHLRRVQIKYLAREYESIERYNEDAEEVVEPYRFLGIADFPAKFDTEAAMRLLSIAEKGVTTGIYLLIHINSESAVPRDFVLDDLLRTGTVITANNEGFHMPLGGRQFRSGKVIEGSRYAFTPDGLPGKDLFNDLMDKVAEEARHGGFVGIPFKKIALSPDDWWTGDSRRAVNVPVGRTGARDPLNFWLGSKEGRNSSHALVGGRTGSGKSTLFHVIIASLATTYSPDEVELYLVDFKEGVEFKPYADYGLPHARVIAIESEREFGLSVLKELQAELERRGVLFKDANTQDLNTYRERTGKILPRLVLVIDEFQVLLSERDAITARASAIIEDLARRGRVFGIHLVFGSQSFRGVEISQAALGQFATRILLQSPEAEVASMLGPDNVAAAQLLERPGELIYNDDGGRRERNQPGQVALLREDSLDELLSHVQNLSLSRDYRRKNPQIVFRGNQASQVQDNTQLEALYEANDWPAASQVKQMFGLREWIGTEHPALAWLGEAIEIRPHTAATFRRRGRSNLLLVGDDEETIFGMLSSAFMSLAAFYPPNELQLRIVDLSLTDVGWSDACELFAEQFNFHDITVQERRGGGKILDQVAQVVARRVEQYEAGNDELGPSLYLVVAGAHRMPELRPTPGRFGRDDPSEAANKLTEIARRGPEVGVYTIVWYDSVKSFEYGLGRQVLGYFDRRVALPMSDDDSQYLLRETAAGKLPRFRALLLDDEQNEPLEKFKPYALPEAATDQAALFADYAGRLRRRLE
jgi:DNA segregation ATPase FtsK/SpoIIIE, S-DNA-T family